MRLTRKTMVALGISGAMTVLAGVSASAAVLDLPILGFGEAANETAAPPQVVHRTVYDDHYVTTPTTPKAQAPAATSGAPKAAATTGAPAPSTAAPSAAPTFSAASASAPAPAPTPAPAPAFTPPPTEPPTTQPPATTVGRPPVPAGCREPEWDAEHQVWHCSNSGVGDD
jgi:hypothetical protein